MFTIKFLFGYKPAQKIFDTVIKATLLHNAYYMTRIETERLHFELGVMRSCWDMVAQMNIDFRENAVRN